MSRQSLLVAIAALALTAGTVEAQTTDRSSVCIPAGGLTYVGDASAPPVEFIDEQGQPAGIHIDLIRGIERDLGIPITIRLMSKLEATTAMQRGEAQLTALAQAESRQAEFDFLASTVRSRLSVLLRPGVKVRSSQRDLSGLRIAVTRGSYTYEVLSAIDPKQRPIFVSVDGRDTAAKMWKDGEVDGMAGSGAALVWLVRSLGETGFVEVPFETVLMNFVTQKGCGAELASVTEAMQKLREQGAVDAARERWAAPPESSFWETARYAGLGALTLITLVLVWNRALRRQVLERTSALEAAKEAAEAATRAKSEFLATMSHEIRTPLNAVIATASVLETTMLDQDQRELVEVIRQGGNSLLSVISDVLDFSKVEAGRLELHVQPFDIFALIRETVSLIDRTASDKGLEVTVDVHPSVPRWLTGDSHRLRQVLLNLLSNAVKFTANGSVTVRAIASVPDATGAVGLRVAVCDTGLGIPPERLHRVFQPFTQADSSTTRRFGGTGLGLTISRRLIELMGGHINVTSEVDRGSTFTFDVVLPGAAAPAVPVRETPVRQHTALRVLMAEDNPVNQLVQRRMITHLGHTCDVVSDGQEAIAAAAKGNYDVIVLDLQMPIMGGLEAAQGIRQQGSCPWLIVLTADVTADTRQACELARLDDFLTKPITREALATALGKVPVLQAEAVA